MEDGVKKRNPAWTKDELILALNLYFKHKPSAINKNHPEVIKLSEQLNELSANIQKVDTQKFRNPNGVYMKLCNFLRYDPTYKGVGLKQGSKLEKVVWDTYYNNRKELEIVSKIIIDNIQTDILLAEEEDEFPEGKIIYRVHKLRERNTTEIKKLKEQREKDGELFCEVCGFDFYKCYGEIGKGYIECHHDVPLSYYGDQIKGTRFSDLKLICSNCHKILHRRRPWMKVNELRELLRKS
ncbi:HNH endonuclease [Paenibacillus peoriae]|uniref:HNH endonuclease n=1 Tax=Paenibacillus peoriae TaxID=59893 RepID=UPI00026C616D|nr:HNH endonuclease [Paenibacillus peoriae]MEC0183116.1 HNH endonuclease [Paenibacillus peoriae]